MKLAKCCAAVFILVGLCLSGVTVWMSFSAKHADPVLIEPAKEARHCAIAVLDAAQRGDYAAVQALLLGKPDLELTRKPEDPVGVLFWDAFLEQLTCEAMGDCYATDSGVALDCKITGLDLASVTENLHRRSEKLLEQRMEEASDITQIYDGENNYRESFVREVLLDAARDALAEDGRTETVAITMNLVYIDGQWWVLPEKPLLQAISGGMVQ